MPKKNRSTTRITRRMKRPSEHTPPGAAPGVITAPPGAPEPVIEAFAFNAVEVVEEYGCSLETVKDMMGRFPVTWLNVDGLGNADLIQEIGTLFGLHRLALEDVVHGHQRAKVEQYGDHHFVVFRMLFLADEQLETEQFSIFIGKNFIVTFQEKPGDALRPVRDRIRASRGRLRTSGPDYLAYSLMDAVIDAYFPVLERYGEMLDTLEDEIVLQARPDTLARIHSVKRDLLLLRRAAWPLREVLNSLIRDPNPIITDDTRLYLRDCYDHTVRIIDLVENYRELSADLTSLYLSLLSTKMNEVMKVLTIIATIFIPLTFIVGVYGMNFKYMPELDWYYGYPAVWAVMILMVAVLLGYFKYRGWIGEGADHLETTTLTHSSGK